MGDEILRLRAEIVRQAKLRQQAGEDLAEERRNLLKDLTAKWDALVAEAGRQTRLLAVLRLECEADLRKLDAGMQDLSRRESALTDLRTHLVTGGYCLACGRAQPESLPK